MTHKPLSRMHYQEVAIAARRVEGVEIYRYTTTDDPWLVLKIDGKLAVVPTSVAKVHQLIDFVNRFRSIQLRALDDTDVQVLLPAA